MPELSLDENLREQIAAAERKVSGDIQKTKENFDNNVIPRRGPGCSTYIRNVRSGALRYFLPIKTAIYENILNQLLHESDTQGLDRLQRISEDINSQETKKKRSLQEKKRIEDELKNVSTYDKFMLYGDINPKHKGKKDSFYGDTLRNTLIQTQKNYEAKRRRNTVQGIISSLIFAAMDFNIIYNVFLSSNMALNSALVSAFLSAVMLDIPPYVLGNLLQRKNDHKRLWVLRGKLSSKAAKVDMKPYVLGSWLLVLAIILFFLMYLTLRVILFFGGGDFDLALHFLLEWRFDFGVVEFNSSDFISAVFPIVTSAVAFVVGLTNYESYTGLIEKTAVIVEDELRLQIENCDAEALKCDEAKRNLNIEFDMMKREIWTFYFKKKPMPTKESEFRQKVSAEFQRLKMDLYPEMYRSHCIQLQNKAKGNLSRINTELAPSVSDPVEIGTMAISSEEQDILDTLWITEPGSRQSEETMRHLKTIQSMIQKHNITVN